MNAKDRQRIRTEILQLMTPPVAFRIKKMELSFHGLYLIAGSCLLFTGIQIGTLSTEQRLVSYHEPEHSLTLPVSEPVYYINGRPVPTGRQFPELPEIELVYSEKS